MILRHQIAGVPVARLRVAKRCQMTKQPGSMNRAATKVQRAQPLCFWGYARVAMMFFASI